LPSGSIAGRENVLLRRKRTPCLPFSTFSEVHRKVSTLPENMNFPLTLFCPFYFVYSFLVGENKVLLPLLSGPQIGVAVTLPLASSFP